jgi:hypothetical protein
MSQIAALMQILLVPIAAYAQTISGKAIIASDFQHAWEYCQNNENFPKFVLVYTGENLQGDFQTAAINRMANMDFSLLVSRNRSLTVDRGMSLTLPTGNAIPLFEIVETARDIIRFITGIEIIKQWPIDYKGITQWETGQFISDAYSINFSCAVALPDGGLHPQVLAP